MIAMRGIFRVFLLAAGIFLLASPGMARPAQKLADATDQQRLPIILKQFTFGNGTVTGSVINAADPVTDVSGALVCWKTNCVLSNEGGEFTLDNVANGYQTLTASADGFVPGEQIAYVVGNTVNHQNIAIIPDVVRSGVQYRILTTWDTTPCWPDPNGIDCWQNDLDAHMWRFDTYQSVSYHIGYYYHYNPDPQHDRDEFWLDFGDCRGYPNACLERDARSGYGPETLAIKEREVATYYFGVFNANQGRPGVPPISQTGAIMRFYDKTGLVKTYNVPVDGGDKVFWYVFSLDQDGVITDRNCIIDYIADYDTATWPVCP